MREELLNCVKMIPGVTASVDHVPSGSKLKTLLFDTERGRQLCVLSTLLFLWLTGGVAMVIIEGWNMEEGLYFATFALLTGM
jgi:hypothetical protein